MTDRITIDISDAFTALKEQLREELRAELTAADARPAYMGTAEAAGYLGISRHRLFKLVQRRAIPYAQEVAGGRLSFSRRDLDRHLAEQTVQPRKETLP